MRKSKEAQDILRNFVGDFVESVRGTSLEYAMDLSRPLCLVSGGPDSVALLRAVLELGGEPTALHVDYGLRGDESRGDSEFTRALCQSLGARCEVRRVRIAGSSNFQERAREERYRLARSLAAQLGSSTIATGHTADDVAETVLMNLARGSGLRGLSGVPPTKNGVSRPLIRNSRDEVLEYLESLGQSYRTDSTNLTMKYARNRVRLEVLPLLEELHPGASRNLARAANLAREDLETLETLASAAIREESDEVVADLESLESRALRRHAVRGAYEVVVPGAPLESGFVEEILTLARRRDGTRTLDLPNGVTAAVRFGREVALYLSERDLAEPEEAELSPGELVFRGWRVSVREEDGLDEEDAARSEVAYLDVDGGPYRVRVAREGDTIRPLGLGGSKKVFRAMMDRKVPRDARARTPVVVDGRGRVAWIFLGELGEEFPVGEAGRAIRLEVRKL